MNITLEFVYSKNDIKFNSDYCKVNIILGDKVIKSFGDYYHDKGHLKAISFIEGMQYMLPNEKINTNRININGDEEY